ncbi:hypothetical protein ES705_25824 [subsurface metagenome]
MKWCINYPDGFVYLYPVFISNGKLFYFTQVNLIYFRTNYIKQAFLGGGGAIKFFNQRIIFYPVDVGDYSIGNLRDYLSAIGSVDFIAVVFGRVVAGGNHYTGYGVKVAHGKGKLGSGADILKEIGFNITGIKD